MGFVQEMTNSVMDIWNAYLEHPFIKEMANGTLPENKIKWYIIEDSLYLGEYVKVCAIGILKAKSMKDMAKFNSMISGIVQGEYALRDNYLAKAGIGKNAWENMTPSRENRDYANYILKATIDGDLPELLAATLPCSLSYYYIGKQLAERDPKCLERRYGELIADLASEICREMCELSSDYMDALCEGLDENRKQKLTEIFREASIYEMGFWNMVYQERD